jgi:hypothetical protein
MAAVSREVRETTVSEDNGTQYGSQYATPAPAYTDTGTAATETDPDAENIHGKHLAVRIIWFIDGVLMAILGLRFLLALFGGNAASGFVSFIYTVSQPFVAPFFGAFGYSANSYVAGHSYFEGYTLLAMLVYSLIAWGITKLITINRREPIHA